MEMIRFLLGRSRGVVALAIAAGVLSGATSTGLLALINTLLQGGGPRLVLGWSFVALCLLVPGSRIAAELLLSRLGQDTILKLRMELSRRVLAVPLRRLEEIGAPAILSTLTDDVPTIANVVSMLPNLCINLATLAGCLLYLGWLSWQVLAAVVVLIALGILSYQWPILKATTYLRRARGLNDALYFHFRALTDGAKELKLNSRRREAFLERDLESAATECRDQSIAGMRVYTIAGSWGQLLVFIVIGFLLFVLPGLTGADSRVLSGYTLTLLYLMTPLQVIMNLVPNFSRADVALGNIERLGLNLTASPAEGGAGPPARVAGPTWRRLELLGVTHAYRREGDEQDFVLGPIDLTLTPGELVFIAGGNGSGKTTLAKLVTGLYAPESGEIRLDGRAVAEKNREAYRQLFSVIFSDFYLFGSLLGLERPQVDTEAREYLKQLHLSHKVRIESGILSDTKLSQGQRKRLALLTALLEDRPIYLFDEWAADQDPVFKEIFYCELLPALRRRGKAVLVISHDDRYYDIADRLLKIDNGKVVAETRREGRETLPDISGNNLAERRRQRGGSA